MMVKSAEPWHTAVMRKRVRIALAVLLVATAGVMTWQVMRPQDREPVYQGRSLRVWLQDYSGTGEVTNAVLRIGTNGIPTLLEMLRKKDSPSVSKLIYLWDRALGKYTDLYVNSAQDVNASASMGFKILGVYAHSAAPALINIYEQHDSFPDRVSMALLAVGPEIAIPLFVRDTGSTNPNVRIHAVMALGNANPEPQMVVPALVKLLSDTYPRVRYFAATGLGHLATNAQQTVPALVLSFGDPIYFVRDAATNALRAIDPEAAARAGVK